MKETNKRNSNVEKITKATRAAVKEEATVTQKSTVNRLQETRKQVSEAVKLVGKTHT